MTYSATILAEPSLVAYYQLNEASGASSAADSKGNNTGTNYSVTCGAASLSALSTCYQFNGSSSYISITRCIQDDWSIEWWMKCSSTPPTTPDLQYYEGWGLVSAEVDGYTNDFGTSLVRYNGANILVAGAGNGDIPDPCISTPTTLNMADSNWHHVVFTRVRNTGLMTLYVDGNPVASGTGGTGSQTAPSGICIGAQLNGGGYYNGLLDEVALYNTALSASSISAHYAAGTYVTPNGCSPTGVQQNTAITVTVTGTGFSAGSSVVTVSGSGVTVGTVTVLSATSLTAVLHVSGIAATGSRTLTITTGTQNFSTSISVLARRGSIDYDQMQAGVCNGDGAQFQMFGGGTTTQGHAAVYDGYGNLVDSGAAPAINPMTSQGDLIIGGLSGAPTRLAAGISGYVLTSAGPGSAPTWAASSGGGSSTNVWGEAAFTAPVAANLTHDNFGSTTTHVDTLSGPTGVRLRDTGSNGSNTNNLRSLLVAIPTGTSNWRFTARLRRQSAIMSWQALGIVAKDSVSGKYIFYGWAYDNGPIAYITWTNANSYGTPTNIASYDYGPNLWFRWYTNSNKLYFQMSTDGQYFSSLYSTTTKAFLTNGANYVGIGINPNSTGFSGEETVLDCASFLVENI